MILVSAGLLFAGAQEETTEETMESTTSNEMSENLSGNIGQWATISDYSSETGRTIDSYNEAPMLTQKVSAGELPPVEERLPEEPAVVEPEEIVGDYGGTLTHAGVNPRGSLVNYMTGYEPLVRWARDGKTIIPGVAKDYEISDGGRTYTMYLREGMKWSDGEPFTTEDLMFWWDDVINNENLYPSIPFYYKTGGEPMEVTAIDDYTIRFEFTEPAGLFLEQMAFRHQYWWPKHFMKQFHADYADADALKAEMDERGFDTWHNMFLSIGENNAFEPGLPTLKAWYVTEYGTNKISLERNPYYYKVDTKGNQLPYIDNRFHPLYEDHEIITLKAISGEIDWQAWGLRFRDYPLLKENEEKGDYRVFTWASYPLDFPRWNEDAQEYDAEKANELLDGLGLEWDEDREWRLNQNGEQLAFVTDIRMGRTSEEFWELMQAHLAEVGIKIDLRFHTPEVWMTKVANGETSLAGYNEQFLPNLNCNVEWQRELLSEVDFRTAVSHAINRPEMNELLYFGLADTLPYYLFHWELSAQMLPVDTNCFWGPKWGLWYSTNGEQGVEPPEHIKKMQNNFDELQVTADPEEKRALMDAILKDFHEGLYQIKSVRVPWLVIARSNLRNVLEEKGFRDWRAQAPGYTNMEQWSFIEDWE